VSIESAKKDESEDFEETRPALSACVWFFSTPELPTAKGIGKPESTLAMTFDATVKDMGRDSPQGILTTFDRPSASLVRLLTAGRSAWEHEWPNPLRAAAGPW
jgi:hypothetical protein